MITEKNTDVVEIEVDGIVVKGKFTHRCSCDFTIAIIEPYQNLSSGSHIPNIARGSMSFDGERGDLRSRETLKFLYSLGKYLEDEMSNLKVKIKSLEEEIDKFSSEMIDDAEFKRRRIELRKKMKANEITDIEFQKLLTPLKREKIKLESKIRMAIGSFCKNNFPMIVPYGVENEVIDIIRGNKELKVKKGEL